MPTGKRNIFMTSLYTDINKKLYIAPAKQNTDDFEIKTVISRELSERYMEQLVLSLYKMNKSITQCLLHDLILKGLK